MIDFTKVNAVVQEFAPQMFVDTVTRRSEFYNLLRKTGPSSPQGPRWQVKVAGASNAAPFAEGDAAPSADEFEKVQASLAWGNYHTTVSLGGLSSKVLAAANATYIANYMQEQFADSFADLVDEINADLLGGATTNGITGITSAISDTGTYAGISRSSYAGWQSYVNDNSSTPRPLTMALMDTTFKNLVDTNGGNFSHILCDQDTFDEYTALTSGNGYPASARLMVGQGDTSLSAVAGYTGASYRGRPIVPIPGYTATRMDFVDLNALRIEVLDGFSLEPLAKTNEDMRWYGTIHLQMVLPNPKKQAAALVDLGG